MKGEKLEEGQCRMIWKLSVSDRREEKQMKRAVENKACGSWMRRGI